MKYDKKNCFAFTPFSLKQYDYKITFNFTVLSRMIFRDTDINGININYFNHILFKTIQFKTFLLIYKYQRNSQLIT